MLNFNLLNILKLYSKTFTFTQICRDENLSKKICNDCISEVVRSFLFRKKAINADCTLRNNTLQEVEFDTSRNVDNNSIKSFKSELDIEDLNFTSDDEYNKSSSTVHFIECKQLQTQLFEETFTENQEISTKKILKRTSKKDSNEGI